MRQIFEGAESTAAKLHKAITRLYKVFAKYPVNPRMNGSPLYHELAQWNRALTTKPLKELSEEDLSVYYFKALTTWGNVNDFKHFLPRILELLTELPTILEEWVALDKLNYGHYDDWPADEQAAIHQFLLAFWQTLLCEESTHIDALFEGYFPAIANVYPDFNRLLQLWSATDRQPAAQRLASFICRYAKQVLQKRVLPGFRDSIARGELFFEWLQSDSAVALMKKAVSSEAEPYLDLELAPIISKLEQR